MFRFNEGPLDRALRISAGVVLLWLGVFSGFLTAPLTFVAAGFGVLMFATGTFGVCPLYNVLGFSTVPR